MKKLLLIVDQKQVKSSSDCITEMTGLFILKTGLYLKYLVIF